MLSNALALAMYFGVFGSIFFLAQFMQGPMGYTPFEAGLRTLPWTAAPMLVVPVASALVGRVGGGRLQALGCVCQGAALVWLAVICRPGLPYGAMVGAMALAGVGMGLVFAANPATVIGSVAEHEHNLASGVNNTVREFGGALGIAVLTAVYVHGGLRSAVLTGAAVVLLGTFAGLAIRPAPEPARPGAGPAPSARAAHRQIDPHRPVFPDVADGTVDGELHAVGGVRNEDGAGEAGGVLDDVRPTCSCSAHSVTAVAARPMLSMPCAMTPGRPTAAARVSDQWMGLWSPDAAA
ncbi:hypothetical protein STENM223S_04448 [Streptomyces tendae]